MFLSWKKTSYDSNKAKEHLKNCNSGGRESIIEKLNESKMKTEEKHDNLVESVKKTDLYHHLEVMKKNTDQKLILNNTKICNSSDKGKQFFCVPSYYEKSWYAQAKHFLYCSMAPPFKMFCDPLFKNMLVAMIPNSNGQPN